MRLALASLAAAALLSACDGAPSGSEPSGPVGAGGPVGENAANSVVVQPNEAGALPQPTEGLRFVGIWAADQRSCEAAGWQFTETSLRTPAGAQCSFNRVTEVPGGYDIQATCTAEGPPTSDTLRVRFAEGVNGMRFESETIADTGLYFCGREA